MASRYSMPQGSSEAYFRRTSAAHPRNFAGQRGLPYRGGIRL
jgi:hypothetical protein